MTLLGDFYSLLSNNHLNSTSERYLDSIEIDYRLNQINFLRRTSSSMTPEQQTQLALFWLRVGQLRSLEASLTGTALQSMYQPSNIIIFWGKKSMVPSASSIFWPWMHDTAAETPSTQDAITSLCRLRITGQIATRPNNYRQHDLPYLSRFFAIRSSITNWEFNTETSPVGRTAALSEENDE